MSLRRIVVVSKEAQVTQLAQQVGREIFVADDPAEALDIVKTVEPNLILFDYRFGPGHICEFKETSHKHSIDPPPIVAVGDDESDIGLSEEYKQVGAYDYLYGTQDYSRLEQIVSCLKNETRTVDFVENSKEFFIDDYAASVSMVGRSRALVKTFGMIRLVAASKCNPVLIVGETGTGKELAAMAVHALRHPKEPFVAVNCAALTANLLESELFGHEKGSFTGADREKTGLLEVAGAGTMLLDEISEMPMDLQSKLLRVLQEKTFRKVGGVKNITCNATIIASSNRNLYRETKAHRFRRDLYYRLNICPVIIAPLKSPDRKKDIPLLAEYFLKTSTICPEKSKKITSLTKLAVEALIKHDWPGNIRELQNVIERAILLETTDKIGLSSIIIDSAEYGELFSQTTNCSKDFSLEKAERELIARALQETGWQKTRAAALLGITRATLYAKVKQYNIEKASLPTENLPIEPQEEISTPSLPQYASTP
ncbi:MAG: AAA domain-containing protein [Phycisphaerae bacterium]|nr:sigma-54-dependent Fis family transcriptional regulator [Phycisphaerae bacterium]NIP52884.1 sigma-54-dependent Fis family transcriptional regulator [Phycisphaerae bacterium]NIS51935.1 sigma-54-dependent Fis family transcriptional regulator [Phycisphaerae bacterium]NIU09449.1 sigma-54-dependent Fis family transcriptional regulator [Phycisphaerae bacterium]NIU57182.1 AAA domain-containing protein [Phycisphaerae bacterium]